MGDLIQTGRRVTSETIFHLWLRRYRRQLILVLLCAVLGGLVGFYVGPFLHRRVSRLAVLSPAPVVSESLEAAKPELPIPPEPPMTMEPIPPEPIPAEPMPPQPIPPEPIPTAPTPPAATTEGPAPVIEPAAPLPVKPSKPVKSATTGLPAWQSFAVPSHPAPAMVTIIIDDMGLDRRRSARITSLPGPLTISFMSYATHLSEQATEAHRRGHELMMHVPMQPLSDSKDAGPDVLTDQLSPEELQRRLVQDLNHFRGYVGINNHMGSRFTADKPGMQLVMQELHRRGLLFIDSLTSEKSVGLAAAREAGVPSAARNLFLDDLDDDASIAAQLAKVEQQALKSGSVIAIGHPRDKTIEALAAWLPTLADKGLTLVPVTAIVRVRQKAH